jgi:Xaa-Pro aminopeptidase
MTDVLIIGDTFRSPELRHEVPLGVPDPFVYLERDGARHVYVGSMEVPRIRGVARDITVHPLEEVGIDELVAQGLSVLEVRLEWAARAAGHAGLTHAVVPNTFPSGYLDRIRRDGVELTVDQGVFDARRRVKAGAELDGVRRAQRAAEAGLAAGVSLMRQAENGDGVLWLDGEPLTAERVKAAIRRVFAEHGCTAEDFVVAPGPQGAAGHDMGHGPIRFGDPVVFDLWPRDDASSCYADMTRTIVAGPVSDQVREWHTLTKAALDASTALIRAGADCRSIFDVACEVYEGAGYPTQRTKTAGEVLDRGFFHGLGHGVGLEVHEGPSMGLSASGQLVAGDIVTIEPGCYDPAIGGVRLEDLVLVTDDGCEVLTKFPYDLEV